MNPIIDPSALTEEQRETIKDEYNYYENREYSNNSIDQYCGATATALLVRIFGKHLFKKGE